MEHLLPSWRTVASSLGAKLSLEEILVMCNIFFGTLACECLHLHNWMLQAMNFFVTHQYLQYLLNSMLFNIFHASKFHFSDFRVVFNKKSLTKVAFSKKWQERYRHHRQAEKLLLHSPLRWRSRSNLGILQVGRGSQL